MTGHAHKAAQFLKNSEHAAWHDETLWIVRRKRDKMARAVPEWEALREQASQIKQHTLAELDKQPAAFEKPGGKNGAPGQRARGANPFNENGPGIIKENNATKVVKSKSMLTEECGMNPFLEKQGIEVTDTDL